MTCCGPEVNPVIEMISEREYVIFDSFVKGM